jgi:hypothetical protein
MIEVHRQLPAGLTRSCIIEATRHDLLEPLAIVADDPDAGNAGSHNLTGSRGDKPRQGCEIALGHQALRLLEQARKSCVGHLGINR